MFCASCIAQLDQCPVCRKSLHGRLSSTHTYMTPSRAHSNLFILGTIPRFIIATLNSLEVICPICSAHVPRVKLVEHIANDPVGNVSFMLCMSEWRILYMRDAHFVYARCALCVRNVRSVCMCACVVRA